MDPQSVGVDHRRYGRRLHGRALPIRIFNSLRHGYLPVMAAVAELSVLVAVVVFGLIGRFGDLPRLLRRYDSMRG